MKFAFVSRSVPMLKILNGFSTAVSGVSNYRIHFCCSLLSLQKISVIDLPHSGNSLITLVILKIVISPLMKLITCCYHLVSGSAFNFFALQKVSKQCIEMAIVCLANIKISCKLYLDVQNSIVFVTGLSLYISHVEQLPWILTVQEFRGLTPLKDPRIELGERGHMNLDAKKTFMLLSRLQLKFIVS